jgi:hypothetical protein
MAFDPDDEVLVLFGGYDATPKPTNETWLWNGESWTEASPEVSPPPRSGASMAYSPPLDGIVLFGGSNGAPGGHLGDTWLWDGETWTEMTFPHSPNARFGAALAHDPASDATVLFGGNDNQFLSDTWTLRLAR